MPDELPKGCRELTRDELLKERNDALDNVAALKAQVDALTAERDELNLKLDIIVNASRTAANAWMDAHPGHTMFPSHIENMTWLIDRVAALTETLRIMQWSLLPLGWTVTI